MTEDLKKELLAKGGTLSDWELALTSGIALSDQQWVDAKLEGQGAQDTVKRVMAKGNMVEYECYDNRGRPQGRAIIKLMDWAEYGSTMLRAEHVLASDGYYDWYGKNSLKEDKAVYHICGGPRRSCREKLVRGDRREVVHVEKWRMMTPLMAALGLAALKEWVKEFRPTVPGPAAPPARARPGGGAERRGTGADAALAEIPDEDSQEAGEAEKAPKGSGKKGLPRQIKGSVGALLEKKITDHRAAMKKKEEKEKREKKEKERSRGRKRRRKDRSSERSGSRSSGTSQEDFRMPSTRGEDELWRRSQRHPGRLLKSGMEELQKFLANRVEGEGEGEGRWTQYKMMGYVSQVILTQHPPSAIGVRNHRELITLGTGIDLLLAGKVAKNPGIGSVAGTKLEHRPSPGVDSSSRSFPDKRNRSATGSKAGSVQSEATGADHEGPLKRRHEVGTRRRGDLPVGQPRDAIPKEESDSRRSAKTGDIPEGTGGDRRRNPRRPREEGDARERRCPETGVVPRMVQVEESEERERKKQRKDEGEGGKAKLYADESP
eukprot:Skav228849  [mRNA]  locus=scaffold4472:6917:8557:+ [translate_table: standard]